MPRRLGLIGGAKLILVVLSPQRCSFEASSGTKGISSSGLFELTITAFERAKTRYGNRKGFNFELKQRLEEARYTSFSCG